MKNSQILGMIKTMMRDHMARSKKRYRNMVGATTENDNLVKSNKTHVATAAETKEHLAAARKKEVRNGYIKIAVVLVLTIVVIAVIVYALQRLFL